MQGEPGLPAVTFGDGANGRASGYGFIGASDKALQVPAKEKAITDCPRRLGGALTSSRRHPAE
ncbi:hypothetical protein [Streptomyces sp. HNM1019]